MSGITISHTGPQQRGLALISVLWLLAVLSVISFSLSFDQRIQSQLTRHHLNSAWARALSDATLHLVIFNLLLGPGDLDETRQLILPDGQPASLDVNGHVITFRLFTQDALLDLNRASDEQLRRLINLSLDEKTLDLKVADQIAAAIIDWRDRDQLSGVNGAEDPAYQRAGTFPGAADQPFKDLSELETVLGMTPELFLQLSADLRIDGPIETKLDYASARVLSAIQNLSLPDAEKLVDERRAARLTSLEAGQWVDRGGSGYRLLIGVPSGTSTLRTTEIHFSLTLDPDRPFVVEYRREGLRADDWGLVRLEQQG